MSIHIDPINIGELLSRRTHLRVFAGCDPTVVMAEGELIAYAVAPTVVLRHRDGSKTSWQTTLPMEEIPAPAAGHPVTGDPVVLATEPLAAGQHWIVARDGGRFCERCEWEIRRGEAYELLPGSGGLLQHVHCPDQGKAKSRG